MHPCSCVSPVVHRVIDLTHVPAHGGSQARCKEIRFCCDGVLLIAQIIADEGEHFEQHLAEIRRMRFLPRGQDGGHAVLHQAKEAFEVLREIGDVDWR